MSKLVEGYLDYLNGDKDYISEGLLTTLNKLFVLFGYGSPKDPKILAIRRSYLGCVNACDRAFPAERSTTRTTSGSAKADKQSGEMSPDREKEEMIETIKENPEHGKCLTVCKYDRLRLFVSTIKQNRKNICNKNLNKDLCEKWIERFLPQLEADAKVLKNVIDMMKGVKQGDNKSVNVVINKLKKLL